MLVSVVTQFRPTHYLIAPHIDNINIIGAKTIGAPTTKLLTPSLFANASAFSSKTIQPVPATPLTLSAFANANTFPAKNIQKLSSGTVYETPAYANAGGTGNRTSIITVTTDATLGGTSGPASTLVNGAKPGSGNNAANACWVVAGQSNKRFRFQFTHRVLITEAKWFQNGAAPQGGTWKWRGSDDGVAMTDLSTSFTLDGGATGSVIGNLAANATGFIYYDLQQTGGTTSDTPWLFECDFKIGNPV